MKQRLINVGRQFGLWVAAKAGILPLLRPRGETSAIVLLFHRFFDIGESRSQGIERLRRELDWLQSHYTPISLSRFMSGLESGTLPDRAVLITVDDALIDLIHVAAEFRSFDVPLAVFVCTGWTAMASQGTGEDLLARAAATIQWYEATDVETRLGSNRVICLSPTHKSQNIDSLITEREALLPYLAELCTRIDSVVQRPRQCCTWSELRDLAGAGVEMGAHSVTHIWISQASAARRLFEIAESKRVCEAMLGPCHAFAYPYGMAETHSLATRQELERVGYSIAFLTHSDYITANSDRLTLPRLPMPDYSMSLTEFQARVRGVGIVMRRIKAMRNRSSDSGT